MRERLLAAYTVFKLLASEKKSTYDLLIAFIEGYISEKNCNRFLISKFTTDFNNFFGFRLPSAIIKSVLQKMGLNIEIGGYCKIPVEKAQNFKKLDLSTQSSETEWLLQELVNYATKTYGKIQTKKQIEQLKQDFIDFFAQPISNRENLKIISEFIVLMEKDERTKILLSDIKQGSLIYKGITFDCETDNLSSASVWNTELNIYLNTDVLFDIIGYNGEFYQKLSMEFLDLVKEINKRREYIKLRYFRETLREVKSYFFAAEYVLTLGTDVETEAMSNILKNCTEVSDIYEKKGAFFSEIAEYDIKLEEEYFTEIEQEDEEDDDGSDKEVIKINDKNYIEHIIELRGDENNYSFENSKYIFLTRKTEVFKFSQDKVVLKRLKTPLAVGTEYLTERFWFSLKKGFGDCSLKSFDVFTKSKLVYSGIIAEEKRRKLTEIKKEIDEKGHSDKKLMEMLVSIKSIKCEPENINSSSMQSLQKFHASDLNAIREDLELKDIKIDKLSAEKSEKEEEIKTLKRLLAEEKIKYRKRMRILVRIFVGLWNLCVYIVFPSLVAGIFSLLCHFIKAKFEWDLMGAISIFLDGFILVFNIVAIKFITKLRNFYNSVASKIKHTCVKRFYIKHNCRS